jgi:nuclear cap-binding protein subunit 1
LLHNIRRGFSTVERSSSRSVWRIMIVSRRPFRARSRILRTGLCPSKRRGPILSMTIQVCYLRSPALPCLTPRHLARPHYDAAQSVLNLLRGRSKADEVISHLNQLRNQLADRADGVGEDVNVDAVVRALAVQSLLHIGARSFSHFLNAIERYLPVLRHLAQMQAQGADAKADILTAAAVFWKRSRQMVGIVFDKLMQYQIVDPTDVVAWTFGHGGGAVGKDELGRDRQGRPCVGAYEWDLLKAAIDKANGRVLVAKRKVTQLRKEEDDTRARENAVAGMEVDADAKPGMRALLSFRGKS